MTKAEVTNVRLMFGKEARNFSLKNHLNHILYLLKQNSWASQITLRPVFDNNILLLKGNSVHNHNSFHLNITSI